MSRSGRYFSINQSKILYPQNCSNSDIHLSMNRAEIAHWFSEPRGGSRWSGGGGGVLMVRTPAFGDPKVYIKEGKNVASLHTNGRV